MYNRPAAVAYAHLWAHRRNPRYYDYSDIGGDCTSFASQCLFAGLGVMDFAPNGWYYSNGNKKSPSWTGVEFLYEYFIRSGRGVSVDAREVSPGDIVQLSFDGAKFSHSLVVVEAGARILVATHTMDSDYRPLTSYSRQDSRALHVI
jgi:hypothetical protein